MPPHEAQQPVQWAAGLLELRKPVIADGVERTHLLLIATAQGKTINARLHNLDRLLAVAPALLVESIAAPQNGPAPTGPIRLRIADTSLAEVMSSALPSTVTLVVAPTPELDLVFARMYEDIEAARAAAQLPPPPPFLEWGASVEQIAAWFRATAALHRAAPWRTIRRPDHILSVTIESLGVQDWAISMSEDDDAGSFALFLSPGHFYDYGASFEAAQRGDEVEIPPVLAVAFAPPSSISAEALAQVEQRGWERALPTATPNLYAAEGTRPLALCARDVAVTETIALALVLVIAHVDAVQAAYDGGPELTLDLTIDTHDGARVVKFRAPAVDRTDALALRAALHARDGELWSEFESSTEASGVDKLRGVALVCALSVELDHRRFDTIAVDALDALIFETLPRVVRMRPAHAAEVIDSVRAYTSYLIRAHGFASGPSLMQRLGTGATTRLEAAILAPRTFGWPPSIGFEEAATDGSAESLPDLERN